MTVLPFSVTIVRRPASPPPCPSRPMGGPPVRCSGEEPRLPCRSQHCGQRMPRRRRERGRGHLARMAPRGSWPCWGSWAPSPRSWRRSSRRSGGAVGAAVAPALRVPGIARPRGARRSLLVGIDTPTRPLGAHTMETGRRMGAAAIRSQHVDDAQPPDLSGIPASSGVRRIMGPPGLEPGTYRL